MVRRVGLTTDFESVRSALDAVTVVGDTSERDALFLALHTAAPEATRPLLLIIFLHYWGTGPADQLATGFKAAVSELGKHGTATASR